MDGFGGREKMVERGREEREEEQREKEKKKRRGDGPTKRDTQNMEGKPPKKRKAGLVLSLLYEYSVDSD